MKQSPTAALDLEKHLMKLRVLALCGLMFAMASAIISDRLLQLVLAAASATLLCLSVGLWLAGLNKQRKRTDSLSAATDFINADPAPHFITRNDGKILSLNPAAKDTFSNSSTQTLAGVLKLHITNAGGTLYPMQSRAFAAGSAQEDVVTSQGHIRISVQRLSDDGFFWRIQLLPAREIPRAVSEGQALPMLMVGRTDAILYMNEAARQLVGKRMKGLDRLFQSLPIHPGQGVEMMTKDGLQNVLVAEVEAGAGRRALYLLPPPARPTSNSDWQVSEELPVPMIKVLPDGAVLSFNPAAAKLLGVTLIEGALLSQLIEGLGRSITDWLNDFLEGRLAQKSEFLRLTRTDSEVFVQVTLSVVTEKGAPALIAVLNDATELKSLEAQFVQSQKMQAIGQLAGGVAHDFNNLLMAISGHCDLLLVRHDQGDHDYSDLIQINQNANRAVALVGQLLAFSRKQTLRPETLDMRDTLADLTHLLNRLVGERVTLTLRHDPVVQRIRADKRQLEQVLMNLVVNARDAMPAGGEIKITTERITLTTPLNRDRVSVPEGDYVTVEVSDEGTGIPDERLQKVFEPFFTTKRMGEVKWSHLFGQVSGLAKMHSG